MLNSRKNLDFSNQVNNTTMKYKVLKGTELYEKLLAFEAKVKANAAEAEAFVVSIGGGDIARRSSSRVIGEIGAISFRSKPDGWKKVGESWQGLYMPLAKNKEMCQRIAALPTIPIDEANELIKFKQGFGSGGSSLTHFVTYGDGAGQRLLPDKIR